MRSKLEYITFGLAVPFMVLTFVLGAMFYGLIAGWQLAKENL